MHVHSNHTKTTLDSTCLVDLGLWWSFCLAGRKSCTHPTSLWKRPDIVKLKCTPPDSSCWYSSGNTGWTISLSAQHTVSVHDLNILNIWGLKRIKQLLLHYNESCSKFKSSVWLIPLLFHLGYFFDNPDVMLLVVFHNNLLGKHLSVLFYFYFCFSFLLLFKLPFIWNHFILRYRFA